MRSSAPLPPSVPGRRRTRQWRRSAPGSGPRAAAGVGHRFSVDVDPLSWVPGAGGSGLPAGLVGSSGALTRPGPTGQRAPPQRLLRALVGMASGDGAESATGPFPPPAERRRRGCHGRPACVGWWSGESSSVVPVRVHRRCSRGAIVSAGARPCRRLPSRRREARPGAGGTSGDQAARRARAQVPVVRRQAPGWRPGAGCDACSQGPRVTAHERSPQCRDRMAVVPSRAAARRRRTGAMGDCGSAHQATANSSSPHIPGR